MTNLFDTWPSPIIKSLFWFPRPSAYRYTQGLKAHHSRMNYRLHPKIKGKENLTQRRNGATKNDLRCAFAALRETSSSCFCSGSAFPRRSVETRAKTIKC